MGARVAAVREQVLTTPSLTVIIGDCDDSECREYFIWCNHARHGSPTPDTEGGLASGTSAQQQLTAACRWGAGGHRQGRARALADAESISRQEDTTRTLTARLATEARRAALSGLGVDLATYLAT